MRCRSDPVKMEALATRFCESPQPKHEEEDDDEERQNDENNRDNDREKEESASVEQGEVKCAIELVQEEDPEVSEQRVSVNINEEKGESEGETNLEMEVQENEEENSKEDLPIDEELQDEEPEKLDESEMHQTVAEEENKLINFSQPEALVDQESEEIDESEEIEEHDPMEDNNEEKSRASFSWFSPLHSDKDSTESEEAEVGEEAALELDAMESFSEKETDDKALEEKAEGTVTPQEETHGEEEEGTRSTEEREKECNEGAIVARERESDQKPRESSVLPDCLLLMMCEPKLSMEVSKETWVCSTDFIRWQPEKKKTKPVKVKEEDGGDEEVKKRVSVDSNTNTNANSYLSLPPLPQHYQHLQQPPRSSCSLPAAAVSMATMIEQKLVNAVAYEPFVLTRCKSEPMRIASKLATEACFWKNRKLEPHRRPTFGVSAAGIGF